MQNTLKGALAWIGTWAAGLSIGEWVLEIEAFAYICAWGVLVYLTANSVEKWIEKPVEKKNEPT